MVTCEGREPRGPSTGLSRGSWRGGEGCLAGGRLRAGGTRAVGGVRRGGRCQAGGGVLPVGRGKVTGGCTGGPSPGSLLEDQEGKGEAEPSREEAACPGRSGSLGPCREGRDATGKPRVRGGAPDPDRRSAGGSGHVQTSKAWAEEGPGKVSGRKEGASPSSGARGGFPPLGGLARGRLGGGTYASSQANPCEGVATWRQEEGKGSGCQEGSQDPEASGGEGKARSRSGTAKVAAAEGGETEVLACVGRVSGPEQASKVAASAGAGGGGEGCVAAKEGAKEEASASGGGRGGHGTVVSGVSGPGPTFGTREGFVRRGRRGPAAEGLLPGVSAGGKARGEGEEASATGREGAERGLCEETYERGEEQKNDETESCHSLMQLRILARLSGWGSHSGDTTS